MAAELREYTSDDWRPLVDMYTTFEPKGVYMGLPPFQVDQITAWLRGLTDEVRNAHFVLWTGRHVIAHAALIYYPNTPGAQEIIIFVHPHHQGRGWGRKMFLGVLNWACFHLTIDEVWLFVDWHNVRARRLYASVGFKGGSPGLKDPEMLMRRQLRCAPCLLERCPVYTASLCVMPRRNRARGRVPTPTVDNAAFLYSIEIEALHYPSDCPFKTERATSGHWRRRIQCRQYCEKLGASLGGDGGCNRD